MADTNSRITQEEQKIKEIAESVEQLESLLKGKWPKSNKLIIWFRLQ